MMVLILGWPAAAHRASTQLGALSSGSSVSLQLGLSRALPYAQLSAMLRPPSLAAWLFSLPSHPLVC